LRLTRHYGDAEELSQEAFIRAWQNLAKWQNKSSFRSWLFSIGHNCFLDDLRKSKSRAARDNSWLELQEVTNIGGSDSELQRELERILRHFEPQHAAVLEMFYGDGFSHAEISNIMEMPLGSVKSIINRARTQIAFLLKGEKIVEKSSNG
jgi:RNA polymerase sigma-70 factor (ECF subfamily)